MTIVKMIKTAENTVCILTDEGEMFTKTFRFVNNDNGGLNVVQSTWVKISSPEEDAKRSNEIINA